LLKGNFALKMPPSLRRSVTITCRTKIGRDPEGDMLFGRAPHDCARGTEV
jgi:hypothetical protein